MSNFVDDRTDGQRAATVIIIAATDSFMSGWGKAPGKSYCGWACDTWEKAKSIQDWLENRGEMKRVRQVLSGWKPAMKNGDHCHVYWVGDSHPALSKKAG